MANPLNLQALLDPVMSYAMASGYFDSVNGHEPKAPPGNGLTFAVWLQTITPMAQRSGLASTTAVVTLLARLYKPMLSEPQDYIDPALTTAMGSLFTAYTADLDLSLPGAAELDLLGQTGQSLSARAAYATIGNKTYRVYDITIPIIVNDVWDQS